MMAAPPRDWSVFKPRFAEHWEAFQHAHPRDQPSSSDGLVTQRLRGGAPDQMGESATRWLQCGEVLWSSENRHTIKLPGRFFRTHWD